ncbi:MAG TPA: IS701 family transposase [Vicinamibacterales bacterium]|nr:IS701 family transposase [Vicinamibacterales bacterium]
MTESVSAARALLTRLGQFLDRFAGCFGRQAQREGASRYIQGLLNDSERKSMQPMEARLPESDPASYQRLQHFITHSPWPTTKVWARLRAELPIRTGLLLVDETSFPKHGDQSVAVARQYCGALGKIANCQVAVSTGLLTEQQVWPTTMELYLPEEWAADADRRARAEIPRRLTFRPKWRIALTHVRQVRAAGLQLTGVLADAAYGNVHAFRTALDRMGLRYAVGVALRLTVQVTGARRRQAIGRLLTRMPRRAWCRVTWAQGTKGPLVARFAAVRVRPTPRGPECWLLAERPLTGRGARKAYLLNLPASASLQALVRLARGRWPIEQHYREFKDDLGLDHFEGRSYHSWNHHAVIAALTCTFLQGERRRGTTPLPTFSEVRNWVREIVATLYFVETPRLMKLALSFLRDPPDLLRPHRAST